MSDVLPTHRLITLWPALSSYHPYYNFTSVLVSPVPILHSYIGRFKACPPSSWSGCLSNEPFPCCIWQLSMIGPCYALQKVGVASRTAGQNCPGDIKHRRCSGNHYTQRHGHLCLGIIQWYNLQNTNWWLYNSLGASHPCLCALGHLYAAVRIFIFFRDCIRFGIRFTGTYRYHNSSTRACLSLHNNDWI